MPRSRFVGEANAYDITNGKVYLGDLTWLWSLGNDFTGMTIGGSTSPTISMDGQIDMYDAINLAGRTCFFYYTIPNSIGRYDVILHYKMTKQNDDTSSIIRFNSVVASTPNLQSGMNLQLLAPPNSSVGWMNNVGLGAGASVVWHPVAGTEYSIDLVLTPKAIILLIDNVQRAYIERSSRGTTQLSATPNLVYNQANKVAYFTTYHNAGEVSHYRVREVRVSKLVGIGSM